MGASSVGRRLQAQAAPAAGVSVATTVVGSDEEARGHSESLSDEDDEDLLTLSSSWKGSDEEDESDTDVEDARGGMSALELTAERDRLDDVVWRRVTRLYPRLVWDTPASSRLRAFSTRSRESAGRVFTEQSAVEWAGGFVIPDEAIQSDLRMMCEENYDFDRVIKRMRDAIDHDRLSVERIRLHTSEDNPDRDRLTRIAEGFDTMLPLPGDSEPFAPNCLGSWPKPRDKFLRQASAVEKLLMVNFHAHGLALLLPKSVVLDHVPGAHIHASGWAGKPGHAKGRNTSDANDCGGGAPLNSKAVKKQAILEWGAIHNPGLAECDRMISDFLTALELGGDSGSSHSSSSSGGLQEEEELPEAFREILRLVEKENEGRDPDEAVLYSLDLEGAYTLASVRRDEVARFATELRGGLVLFYLCGLFGWTAMPFIFQVITRVCLFELRKFLAGLILMYVDDLLGICRRRDLAANLKRIQSFLVGLLGSRAVAYCKTKFGRRLTFIGYDFDLDLGRATVSAKNLEKAFHGFLTTDVAAPISVKGIQRLASLASRYAQINRLMLPFVRELHCAYAGRGPHAMVTLPEPARRTVRLFQALLALSAIAELEFTRTLYFYRPRGAQARATFDASLTGVGVVWERYVDGLWRLVGFGWVDLRPLALCGPEFQNTAEFIGGSTAVRGAAALGLGDASLVLRGDSITALTWIKKERFRGSRVGPAAMVYLAQSQAANLYVDDTDHLEAELNHRADFISRLSEKCQDTADWAKLVAQAYPELASLPRVVVSDAWLRLCSPHQEWNSDAEFEAFWRGVQGAVREPAVVLRAV